MSADHAVSFAAHFIAAAPPEWKRTARRTGSDPRTLIGLFGTEPVQAAAYNGRPPDRLSRFEVASEAALSFGLAVKDRLLIDGSEYHVVELMADDCGTVSATLRRYGG